MRATAISTPGERGRRRMRVGRRKGLRAIAASDLAKMAVCEQKLVYEKRYGELLTPAQRERIRDGRRGHASYLREAFVLNPRVSSSDSKPWCFIATELWGESADETQLLRSFRDAVLRRHPFGRVLIRAYYRLSPAIAGYIAAHPRARLFAKFLFVPVITAARYALRNAR